MNTATILLLCLLAWILALNKTRIILKNGFRETEPIALRIWLAMMFFAVTMAFLIESFANVFDSWTFNNLSRLIAYGSVALTLYFATSSSLRTRVTISNQTISRWIRPYLILTLVLLTLAYWMNIYKISEWQDHHVPETWAEGWFMFSIFSFAFTMCMILAIVNIRYYQYEKITLMRVRVFMIVLTSISGAAYFGVKSLMVFSLNWPDLGSPGIVTLSKLLLILSALLWGVAFLSNRFYSRIYQFTKNTTSWLAFRDLQKLSRRLDQLCPSILLPENKPDFRRFISNPEFYQYRSVIHILDCRAILEDVLSRGSGQSLTEKWSGRDFLEAERLNKALQAVQVGDDFWEIVQAYRLASRAIASSTGNLNTPGAAT